MPRISADRTGRGELACQPMAFTLASERPDRGHGLAGRSRARRSRALRVHPPCGRRGGRAASGASSFRRWTARRSPLPSLDLMFTEPGLYISKADGDRIAGLARRGEGGPCPPRDVRPARPRVHRLERDRPPARRARGAYRRFEPLRHGLEGARARWTTPPASPRWWRSPGESRERGARHTFEFIAFAAEEWFLFGSEYFVEEAEYRGEIPLYKGVVNCRSARSGRHALDVGRTGLPATESPTRSSASLGVHDRHGLRSPTPTRDQITIRSGSEACRPASRSSCRCRPSTTSRATRSSIVDLDEDRNDRRRRRRSGAGARPARSTT